MNGRSVSMIVMLSFGAFLISLFEYWVWFWDIILMGGWPLWHEAYDVCLILLCLWTCCFRWHLKPIKWKSWSRPYKVGYQWWKRAGHDKNASLHILALSYSYSIINIMLVLSHSYNVIANILNLLICTIKNYKY